MADQDKALQTQLENIQTRTGKTLDELRRFIEDSGLAKHGEIRSMLMQELGLGYGDANTLVHIARQSDGASAAQGASMDEVLEGIYAGSKAPLRPLHEAVMAAIENLGPFEIAPKKANVSLRRKKQFALVGPASKGRLEVGLNMKGVEGTDRLVAQKLGGMCQYKVFLTDAAEVDAELMGWVQQAYECAG